MTPAALLARLHREGFAFDAADGKLRARPPAGRTMTPEEREALRRHKAALLALLGGAEVEAPHGALSPELVAALRRNRERLRELLRTEAGAPPGGHASPSTAAPSPAELAEKVAEGRRLTREEIRVLSRYLESGKVAVCIRSQAVGAEVWIVPRHTRLPRYEVTVAEIQEALADGTGEDLVANIARLEQIRRTFNGRLLAVLPGGEGQW